MSANIRQKVLLAEVVKNFLIAAQQQITNIDCVKLVKNEKELAKKLIRIYNKIGPIFHYLCLHQSNAKSTISSSQQRCNTNNKHETIINQSKSLIQQSGAHVIKFDVLLNQNSSTQQHISIKKQIQLFFEKIFIELITKIQTSFVPYKNFVFIFLFINKLKRLYPEIQKKSTAVFIREQSSILNKYQAYLKINEKASNFSKDSYINNISKISYDTYQYAKKLLQSHQSKNALIYQKLKMKSSQKSSKQQDQSLSYSINQYFFSLRRGKIEDYNQYQDDCGQSIVNYPLISNSLIQSQICWNCNSHYYENQQIIQQQELNFIRRVHRNYTISAAQTTKILNNQDRNPMEEMLCRVMNFGKGYIYLGMKQLPYTNQLDLFPNQKGKENLIKNQYLHEKYQSYTQLHCKKYQVEGIQIEGNIQQNKIKIQQIVDKYLSLYIFPRVSSAKIYKKIEYVPVIQNPIRRSCDRQNAEKKDNLLGLYVIKICIDMLQMHKQNLYYVITKNINNESYPINNFFSQNPGPIPMAYSQDKKIKYKNFIIGQDIYRQMHNKFRHYHKKQKTNNQGFEQISENSIQMQQNSEIVEKQKLRQQMIAHHGHQILCQKVLQLFQHQKNKNEYQQQINLNSKSQKNQQIATDQSVNYQKYDQKYYKKSYQNNKQYYLDNNQQNEIDQKSKSYLVPKIQNQQLQPPDKQLYGYQPEITKQCGYHHSIIILSPTGKQKLYLQDFKKQLQKKKYAFRIYTIYQKLPKKSLRTLYYMTHEKNYKQINQNAKNVDKQRRNLVLLNISSQFSLMNPENLPKALSVLGIKFRMLFNNQYNMAIQEVKQLQNGQHKIKQIFYFQFKDEEQAIFAFVLLQNQNVRCSFVSFRKVQNLKKYVY